MVKITSMTDAELVKAYAQGNNDAFDQLLKKYSDKVFAYIIRTVKNEDVANDIFQDTFVKAILTIKQGRYTENGKFPAWITRIAHNLIIDYYRQTKAENLQSSSISEVDVLNRKELSEATIEEDIISRQLMEDVRSLIKYLPDPQREVLTMRFYRNMSFKEIAEETRVSINTALGRMRYAVLNLRRIAAEKEIALSV
ncbi:MAG: sigma-70 family RNA polymerase sigma factor [Prevotella sp.]|nr:sigma-70 family RNA polymerase sigma factor [Prevotella sp.]CDE09624.1 sigma-70 region 2 [Prevotella sp. CAG:485]